MATAYDQRSLTVINQSKPKFKWHERVLVNGRPGRVEYIYSNGEYFNVRLDSGELTYVNESNLVSEPNKESTVINTPTETNSSTIFNLAATKALVKVAKAKRTFTTDDIWAALPPGSVNGLDPRILGSFMVEAASGGYIKATGRYKPSKRPECHKRPVRVWKSLLFLGK